jgi:hypothetical protein
LYDIYDDLAEDTAYHLVVDQPCQITLLSTTFDNLKLVCEEFHDNDDYMLHTSSQYLYLGDPSITENQAKNLKDFAKTGVVNTAKYLQRVFVAAEDEDHPAIFGIIHDSATSNVDGSVILSLTPVYDGQYGYGEPPAIIAI